MIPAPALSEFQAQEITIAGKTRKVYRIGASGPGVVLMHEIPGMTPNVLRLGRLLSLEGFRVLLPSLFGDDGRAPTKALDAEMLVRMCINAEFNVFAANGSSPVIDWIRELCKSFSLETDGPIGAVGLCITGGFALSLTVGTDGHVRAPVMSEPSLPFMVPFTQNGAAMHLTQNEVSEIQVRRPPCLALRFKNDSLCRDERFESYSRLLGNTFTRVDIPSPDAANHISATAHAVLTEELSDAPGHPTWDAFQKVVSFLRAHL